MSDEEILRRPIGWWLKEADARIDAAFDQVLAGQQVGRRDWQVMSALARSPARRFDIVGSLVAFDEPAEVESVIDGLRARGWVEESGGAVRLTPAGLDMHEALAPLVDQVRKRVAGALPEDEYAALIRLLARLVGALREPSSESGS